jgi:hypothetical protein
VCELAIPKLSGKMNGAFGRGILRGILDQMHSPFSDSDLVHPGIRRSWKSMLSPVFS